ncbi:hypothetical protein [Veillonella sp.]|uniref:hypothetical protein n=1 Tax=Veillonella sp. TaxID=1926307 RepID=UPI0025D3402F|nr:hypothetical protein [Veillonella sp.]
MNKTSDNMEKRIRSVKTWLDKAEQAYADDSTTKGQLQLMLAKAEMQHLDEKHTPTLWQRLGYWPLVIGIFLLLGMTYYMWQGSLTPVPSTTPAVDRLEESDSMGTTVKPSVPASTATTVTETNDASQAIDQNTSESASGNQPVVTSEPTTGAGVEPSSEVSPTADTKNAHEEAPVAAIENTQTNETVTTPVISTTQIQEAVREGGRSLRGQE